jgi:hypothetical protein
MAYLFWHRPREEVAPIAYEAALAGLHRSLASHPPQGFVESAAYRTARLPFDRPAPWPIAYEDWYLVSGWESLGPLESGAVKPPHLARHQEVAPLCLAAVGGLYRSRGGELPLALARFETWFPKPPGIPSDRFVKTVRPAAPADGWSLWQRRLALGPAPEFCLRTREAPTPPPSESQRIELRLVPTTEPT